MTATPKQIGLIARLAVQKGRAVPVVGSVSEASKAIGELLALPDAPKSGAVSEVGIYRSNGEIFKVQKSKMSGNFYAKKLTPINADRLNENDAVVHWTFVYDAGAIKTLKASDRLSLDEAKSWGIKYGVCIVCGATLEDPKSIAAGIGPVCAKRV